MARPTISEFLSSNPFRRIPAAAGRTRMCTGAEMTQLLARFHRLGLATDKSRANRAKARRILSRIVGTLNDADRAKVFAQICN